MLNTKIVLALRSARESILKFSPNSERIDGMIALQQKAYENEEYVEFIKNFEDRVIGISSKIEKIHPSGFFLLLSLINVNIFTIHKKLKNFAPAQVEKYLNDIDQSVTLFLQTPFIIRKKNSARPFKKARLIELLLTTISVSHTRKLPLLLVVQDVVKEIGRKKDIDAGFIWVESTI